MVNAPGAARGCRDEGCAHPHGCLWGAPCCLCCPRAAAGSPSAALGLGDGRGAAGIISGVNRRHWGHRALGHQCFPHSAFLESKHCTANTKGIALGGGRNRAFPLVMGVGRGEEPLALLPSSDGCILCPHLLQLYSTY